MWWCGTTNESNPSPDHDSIRVSYLILLLEGGVYADIDSIAVSEHTLLWYVGVHVVVGW